MRQDDWPAVASIYADGLATGAATFETEVPSWEQWDSGHLHAPRLVAETSEGVCGWIALAPVSARECYRGVVEHSVYVHDDWQGRGIGRALLERLFESTEAAGIWTIQTGVFPENEASLAMHEKCGFRVVGTQERLGKLDGVWRDVVVLERRSEAIT